MLIEDNCKIHQSKMMEKKISDLKIGLLPTVQYSPSLNEPVEGYFGIVKENSYINSDNKSDASILYSIKHIWKLISDDNFDVETSENLYIEWIQRLQICKHGEPIYSGHLPIDEDLKVNLDIRTDISVDRLI